MVAAAWAGPLDQRSPLALGPAHSTAQAFATMDSFNLDVP